MNSKYKIAIIGAGKWGLKHARVVTETEGVELCSIVGRTQEKTQKRAEAFGVPYYLDISQMIKEEHPDFINICVPANEMYEVSKYVIDQEIPFLIEKPLTYDLKQADELVNTAIKKNLFCGVNFIHRYAKPVQMARSAITNNQIGNVLFFDWMMELYGSCKNFKYANLFDSQIHGLDMIEFLCGPIKSVFCDMSEGNNKRHSSLAASLKLENDAVGSFLGSYDGFETYHPSQRLEIYGKIGRIKIEDYVGRYSFQKIGSESEEIWTPGIMNDREKNVLSGFKKHMEEIIKCFSENKKAPIPIECGYRSVYLVHKLIESFESGEKVYV